MNILVSLLFALLRNPLFFTWFLRVRSCSITFMKEIDLYIPIPFFEKIFPRRFSVLDVVHEYSPLVCLHSYI